MRELVIVGAVESTEVAIKSAARAEGWRIGMVVSLPRERATRHSDFCDLASAADAAGAELEYAARINDPDIVDRIRSTRPDLILVVGWSQICGPAFLDIVPGGVLGYHPAALPRLRGRAAIPWTILNAEPITAGTLFWIDAGMDSGTIFEQRFFHVAHDETAHSLYRKHMHALNAMVTSALARVRAGDTAGMVQDERYATYGARRTPADGAIDWTMPTAAIDRLIRAVGAPYPGALTHHGRARVILWEARPHADDPRYLGTPGQIVRHDESAFWVKTVDGLLRVTNWDVADGSSLPLHAVLGRKA